MTIYKIFVWFIFLIFQREYIFLALMLIALCDYIKFKNNFFLHVLISSISAFIIYYVLRKTLFYTIFPYCVDEFPVGVDVRSTSSGVNCLQMSVLRLCGAMNRGCDCGSFKIYVTSHLSSVICM